MWQTAPLEMSHRSPEGHPYPVQSALLGPSPHSTLLVLGEWLCCYRNRPPVASVEGPTLGWSETFLPIFQIDLEEEGETSSPGNCGKLGLSRLVAFVPMEEAEVQGVAETETLPWGRRAPAPLFQGPS